MGLFGLLTKKEADAQLSKAIDLFASATSSMLPGINTALYGWLMNNQNIFNNEDNYTYVKDGYVGNSDVYAVVDLIVTKLAMCPLIQYEVEDGQKWTAYQQLTKSNSIGSQARIKELLKKDIIETNIDGITKLLYTPNPYQTWTEFIKEYAAWYLIQGNSYLYKNGLPGSKKWTEIMPLPATYVTIVSGGAFQPVKGYKIINSATYGDANYMDFTTEQVSHIKTVNLDYTTFGNQLYGMPPLRPYLLTLAKNKLTKKELIRQSKNGGPMGVFSPKTNSEMQPDVKNDIKAQLAEAKVSDDLVKRIIVSRASGEWTQIGLPSVEMELLESLNVDQKDIANCYHTPVQLLNSTDGAKYDNMTAAEKYFIQNAVIPLGNIIADRFTRDLCPPYETGRKRIKLGFDYSVLPEMQQDLKTQAEALKQLNGVLTINESRAYIGYGASDNPLADELMVDGSVRLLSDLTMTDNEFTNA